MDSKPRWLKSKIPIAGYENKQNVWALRINHNWEDNEI